MGKKGNRHPRGIRILIVACDADYVRNWEYIRKTGSRIVRIGGFSIFDCRFYQLRYVLTAVRPAICIAADEKFRKEIEQLAPTCHIIILSFMHPVHGERNDIMDELEAQLRYYKQRKQEVYGTSVKLKK